jgi:hypothetical protein
LLPNLLFWTTPVWWLIHGRRDTPAGDGLGLVIVAAIVTGGWALLTVGREGASTHYLIEPSIPAALWTSIVLCAPDAAPARGRGFAVAAWSTVPMVLFAFALLFRIQCVQTVVGLRARGDRLTLALPGEFDRRAALRDRIRERPPAFIYDEVLSLPWFSTGNTYPATQIEHVVFDALARRGLIESGGVAGLVHSHHFGCIVAEPGSTLARDAREAGYGPDATLPGPIGNSLEIYTR